MTAFSETAVPILFHHIADNEKDQRPAWVCRQDTAGQVLGVKPQNV